MFAIYCATINNYKHTLPQKLLRQFFFKLAYLFAAGLKDNKSSNNLGLRDVYLEAVTMEKTTIDMTQIMFSPMKNIFIHFLYRYCEQG